MDDYDRHAAGRRSGDQPGEGGSEGARPATHRGDLDALGILELFAPMVEPLARALGRDCEVVLHDLRNLEASVYAIGGDLTGRSTGSPPTDLLLQLVLSGAPSDLIGYESILPDGRRCRSSTIFIWPPGTQPPGEAAALSSRIPSVIPSTPAHPTVRPIAALCINIDVTRLQELHALTGALLGTIEHALPGRPEKDPAEAFPSTIESLATGMIDSALRTVGVPVEEMHKRDKLKVVSILRERGIFELKDSMNIVPAVLNVSRFTIYNYLHELDETNEKEES